MFYVNYCLTEQIPNVKLGNLRRGNLGFLPPKVDHFGNLRHFEWVFRWLE